MVVLDAIHYIQAYYANDLACLFFFINETATTEIYTAQYTLSLHDALPISGSQARAEEGEHAESHPARRPGPRRLGGVELADRKSTRLNSSHIEPSRMP